MATSLIQVRIDNDLKAKANQIFADLGLDISSAIRMFLKRSVMENGIPFSMVLPPDKNNLENIDEEINLARQ